MGELRATNWLWMVLVNTFLPFSFHDASTLYHLDTFSALDTAIVCSKNVVARLAEFADRRMASGQEPLCHNSLNAAQRMKFQHVTTW